MFGCNEKSEKSFSSSDAKIILSQNDEIKYYEKVYYKTFGNCDNKLDCAEFKIEYPELISTSNVLDSINSFINDEVLNLPFNEDNYSSLNEISDSLFSSYISVQRSFPDYHTGWYLKSKISVSLSNDSILSLKKESDIFTGGANSNYSIFLSNFDLNSGKLLSLDNIVTNGSISTLNSIAESIFKKSYGIKDSFKDKGYWFENNTFELTDNFIISDSGIVFVYNLYDIAPRSAGITNLFIPKDSLTNFSTIFK